MKLHLLAAVLPGFAMGGPEMPFEAPALLIGQTGETREIRVIEVGKDSFRYRIEGSTADVIQGRLPNDGAIRLNEDPEFSAAMDFYQARKYEAAKAGFVKVKNRFKPFQLLDDSPATLAAFYEMECLRKLGDLEGLSTALQNFPKGALSRETQLRQLELYVMWDAVRTKSWDRLDALANERENARIPGDQRAQVAYCHGLALEGLKRPAGALAAYQTAITADSGASEEIARQAALRILAIHLADPDVRGAMKARDAKPAVKTGKGHPALDEAAAVARLFELTLGAGTPLPADFKVFLKYQPPVS